jgi:hypothetical protein
MIHGLQGAAKLVNNVGRDSTSSAYCEVSDDEVTKESSTSRFRHPNQVLSAFASSPLSRVVVGAEVGADCARQRRLAMQVWSSGVNKLVPV